jgi:hypothetical protein
MELTKYTILILVLNFKNTLEFDHWIEISENVQCSKMQQKSF